MAFMNRCILARNTIIVLSIQKDILITVCIVLIEYQQCYYSTVKQRKVYFIEQTHGVQKYNNQIVSFNCQGLHNSAVVSTMNKQSTWCSRGKDGEIISGSGYSFRFPGGQAR